MTKTPLDTPNLSIIPHSQEKVNTKPTNSPKNPLNLVFVHGFRGNGAGLKQLAPFFPGHNLFFPSLPPANGQHMASYNKSAYLNFLKNYLLTHQIKDPILIGHSMGSIIASAFAHQYPELTHQKLILLAPISQKPHKLLASLQPLIMLAPSKTISYATTKYLFIPKSKPLLRSTLDTTYVCASAYHRQKIPLLKSARFSAQNTVKPLSPRHQILLIAGQKDRLIPLSATKKLLTSKNVTLKTIKNTGHLLNYEEPSAVAKLIQDFIHNPTP